MKKILILILACAASAAAKDYTSESAMVREIAQSYGWQETKPFDASCKNIKPAFKPYADWGLAFRVKAKQQDVVFALNSSGPRTLGLQAKGNWQQKGNLWTEEFEYLNQYRVFQFTVIEQKPFNTICVHMGYQPKETSLQFTKHASESAMVREIAQSYGWQETKPFDASCKDIKPAFKPYADWGLAFRVKAKQQDVVFALNSSGPRTLGLQAKGNWQQKGNLWTEEFEYLLQNRVFQFSVIEQKPFNTICVHMGYQPKTKK